MRRYLIPILLVLMTAVPAGAAEPDNDDPAGAVVVSEFPATLEVDTSEATTGPFEQECYGLVVYEARVLARAVWYRLDFPAEAEYLRITNDGHAIVGLWDSVGTAPTGDPIMLERTCADGSIDTSLFGSHRLYLSVGASLVQDAGPYSIGIEVSETSGPPPIDNDAPYRPTMIASLPYAVDQDTSGAGYDSDPQGCPDGAYVWYSYTPQTAESIEVSVESRDRFNTMATVSVYALGDDVRTLGCDAPEDGLAVADVSLAGGVPVLIGIGGAGPLSLEVHVIDHVPPPNPDARADARALEFGGTLDFDTTDKTLEPGEPESCGSGGSTWFELPALPRDARAVVTGGVSVAAVAGNEVVACSETSGELSIPADSPATHLQVRAPSALGTIGLRFDPALGTQVTDASPFTATCGEPTGVPQMDSEVEVSQAVDPHDPDHLVMAWQQDRYSDRGGAQGIGAAASFDGGATWSTSTVPGVSTCSGGMFQRATDPWVAIGADGATYVMSLSYDPGPSVVGGTTAEGFTNLANSVLINRSGDGGLTWDAPTVVAVSPGVLFHDKETLTADPNTPGLLYAVWNVYPTSVGFPVFSRSEDGGRTWTPPVPLPVTGSGAGDQIAVLDDGTLVDIAARGSMQSTTSHDRGTSWSRANAFADAGFQEGPPGVRGGANVPSVSTDGHSVFVSWSDTRETFFARSDDAGATWSVSTVGGNFFDTPARATTAVAGTDGGRLAVMTYVVDPDLRTRLVMGTSIDGGRTWTEQPITDTFDMERAPDSKGRGRFLGDYFGLSASGEDVVVAFAAVPPGTDAGVSNIYSLRLIP
ncbi:MAG: sialidase family protein [Actinomycetota bacterium]